MTTCFIALCFDDLPRIDACLDSIAACARPGDRVILVDDGSGDGSDRRLEVRAQAGFGPEVAVTPMLLAVHTMGGIGIPANTGLARALADPGCATVCFVLGGDSLDPAGFETCRDRFEGSDRDILICGHDGETAGEAEALRDLALRADPAPGRKLYRADFLRRHGLRFPEGAFFQEEAPFHWEVCLRAGRIGFQAAPLGLSGSEAPVTAALTSTFDHHATIRDMVATLAPERQEALADWLAASMARDLDRLPPDGYWPYAARAAACLTALPPGEWALFHQRHGLTPIGAMAEALRNGNIPGVVTAWMQAGQIRRQAVEMAALRDRVTALETELRRLPRHSPAAEITRFQALMALPHPPPPGKG